MRQNRAKHDEKAESQDRHISCSEFGKMAYYIKNLCERDGTGNFFGYFAQIHLTLKKICEKIASSHYSEAKHFDTYGFSLSVPQRF